jgi:cytochrome c peroxidase
VRPIELGLAGKEREVLARLRAEPAYQKLFQRAFAGDADAFSLDNVTRAIASFERTLISGTSPYDRYRTRFEMDAISPAAHRGEDLFFNERAGCFQCHGGFNFTQAVDFVGKTALEIEFHNTGLYNVDGKGGYPAANTGVHEISGSLEDMGRFRPPTLRNIALTAPYMHDGSIATLEEVIDFYAAGGRNIESGPLRGDGRRHPGKSPFIKGFELTADEKADLLSFLRSLTDEPFLTNPDLASPFDSPQQ